MQLFETRVNVGVFFMTVKRL